MRRSAKKLFDVSTTKKFLSSYKLQHGKLISPLLSFYPELGLVFEQVHRFVQYTPESCINNFVQLAVDVRRQGDANPNSNAIADTMRQLAKISPMTIKKRIAFKIH